MKKIILATTSPYRRIAFRSLGVDFQAEGSNVGESKIERDDPEELVRVLSKMKAMAVAENNRDSIVIGMDSIGFFNGQILEKPKSREEAFQRLKSLSGNNYQFCTGIFMIDTASKREISRVVKTKVFVRELSEAEINKYLNEDSCFNTHALGYNPLEYFSSTFNERIEGSYNNAIRGIPLEEVVKMLHEIGYIFD